MANLLLEPTFVGNPLLAAQLQRWQNNRKPTMIFAVLPAPTFLQVLMGQHQTIS